jgi:hypothetical protein
LKQKQKAKDKTMNTEIYLIKNKVNAGPYSESEVMARVKDGRYAATDLAWYAGCTGPVPLIDILCNPPVAGAISPEPTITKPVTTKPAQKGTGSKSRSLFGGRPAVDCGELQKPSFAHDRLARRLFHSVAGYNRKYGFLCNSWRMDSLWLAACARFAPQALGLGDLVIDSAGKSLRAGANPLHRRKDSQSQWCSSQIPHPRPDCA